MKLSAKKKFFIQKQHAGQYNQREEQKASVHVNTLKIKNCKHTYFLFRHQVHAKTLENTLPEDFSCVRVREKECVCARMNKMEKYSWED